QAGGELSSIARESDLQNPVAPASATRIINGDRPPSGASSVGPPISPSPIPVTNSGSLAGTAGRCVCDAPSASQTQAAIGGTSSGSAIPSITHSALASQVSQPSDTRPISERPPDSIQTKPTVQTARVSHAVGSIQ